MTTPAERLQAALNDMPSPLRHGGINPRKYSDALGGMATAVRDVIAAMAADFTPPEPNTWCKIVYSEKHGPVLVTREWNSDDEVEVVALQVRRGFIMTLSLHFENTEDASDTAKADRAFAYIEANNIDSVLETRGVDGLVELMEKPADGT